MWQKRDDSIVFFKIENNEETSLINFKMCQFSLKTHKTDIINNFEEDM